MTSSLHVVRSGTGPVVLLIHGSAADHSTWSIQLASPLRERFSLWAYDRRGTGSSLAVDGAAGARVEEHAADVAALAGTAGAKVWLVGSSFGAVIALEVMRCYPGLLHGAVLIEPPMRASDGGADVASAFIGEFDRRVDTEGGEAAAEFFLRTVLGEQAFARIPRGFRQRSMSMWRQIRADSVALAAYAPRYAELAAVSVPTLLLGGERSAPIFGATLSALAQALPRAQRETVKAAGHMLHAESHRRFTELLTAFAAPQ
jgi:pimeloyl-ACP methyl ester carboxylesterase